ncbi:MAG: hypothetical protein H0Z29_06065 [Candidatus Marinimicrobia bacterium]|nr:hypothetical protein [Candidatus Neomarinimicrobiota bacterium]
MKYLLKIGNIKIKPPLVLAPMAEYTDFTSRAICKKYGAKLTISELGSHITLNSLKNI